MTLLENPQEPRGSGTVLVFPFFPTGEGSCLVLETTLLDLKNIPTGFVQGSGIGTVKSASPGTMVDVKMRKKCAKNFMYLFVILPMKSKYYTLV